jgi:hypothetical protein
MCQLRAYMLVFQTHMKGLNLHVEINKIVVKNKEDPW